VWLSQSACTPNRHYLRRCGRLPSPHHPAALAAVKAEQLGVAHCRRLRGYREQTRRVFFADEGSTALDRDRNGKRRCTSLLDCIVSLNLRFRDLFRCRRNFRLQLRVRTGGASVRDVIT